LFSVKVEILGYNRNVSETSLAANRQIARAAGTVMVAFMLSNLTGLARQILVANAFGTQAEMEAFNAANRVSETLFNLVAGGALSSAFIPTFTALLAKGEKKKAWELASAIANLILIILTMGSLLAAIFAPEIVQEVLAPGFVGSLDKEILTIQLLRLMLPSAVFFGLSGLVMGILNSNQVFLISALAPSFYQLGMIIGVLFLSPSMGIIGLGWGVVIGAGLHLLVQVPLLLRLGGRYSPILGLKTEEVNEVVRLFAPRLLGVAAVQLNFWINTRLASQFVEGSVTAVVLAFTLMLMPQAAIAQSIAIAAMPTFSMQVALGKIGDMRSSMAASLRGALLLSIPASFGLMILRKPIITLLYQRGEFNERSTELVAWALLWYAAGLVGHAIVEILSRAFYSLHDTKTPVFVGIGAMGLNVVFSYLFSALFIQLGWMPHGGLALANSVATAVEATLLLIMMRRRLGGLNGDYILAGTLKGLFAAFLMSLVIYSFMGIIGTDPPWMLVTGGLIIGIGTYGLSLLAMGLNEVGLLLNAVKKRLLR
jgi:putative peptidoglycan lipid II flippase